MARRWTPQRFVMLRRIRVAACAIIVTVASMATFGVTARKTVALDVNGETQTVTTYAMTATRLLQEQGIDVKSHDLVQSTSGDKLANHAVVTVRSAYQTTINIDGQQVPFWTTATSVDQLLGFFEENESAAAKVTVDIDNVYNQLTGGLVINQNGPVTVIADGKTSVAPNGKLPAASILDSKGIILGKEDRVSVEKNGDETILRVQRVTHGQETRTVTVPHGTQTIVDDSLQPGQTVIRTQGEDGEKQQVYNVTYVDGAVESETLVSETTTKIAIDTVIAVGPAAKEDTSTSNGDNSSKNDSGSDSAGSDSNGSASNSTNSNGSNSGSSSNSGNAGNSNGSSNTDKGNSNSGNAGNSGNSSNSNNSNNSSNNSATKPESNNSTNANSGNSNSSNSNNSNSNNSNSGANNSGNAGNSGNTGNNSNNSTNNSGNSNNSGSSNSGSSSDSSTAQGRLWHATVAQAQAYAAGAAAQRGWTGQNWSDLVKLWNRESGWLWYAENKSSGAYGIPQSLPASKMAAFGANYRDDAAVQIDWGLSYIAQAYGSPSKAWAHSEQYNWY